MDVINTLSAVLAANLLTVCFVWGAVNAQKDENSRKEPRKTYLLAMILPLGMAAIAFAASYANA